MPARDAALAIGDGRISITPIPAKALAVKVTPRGGLAVLGLTLTESVFVERGGSWSESGPTAPGAFSLEPFPSPTLVRVSIHGGPQAAPELLAEERITVWYTAPTAIRMLMKAGTDLVRAHAYPSLRFLASVGEPLNPEAVLWGCEAFSMPFHDNWWQTETGGIMIANYAAVDIKPGSMGLPLPGIEAAIIRRSDDGGGEVVAEPDVVGELALRRGWPSMFRGYLNNEAKYRSCFIGEWYLSGDLAKRDADGYYWFVGRGDDVIKAAGHLISPFEVESALLTHPAVAQAGVIGVPDPVAGAAVKAFVELKPGVTGDAALRRDLLAHARRRLGAAIAPRDIAFVDSLPRTRSGKIMRRVLRARELGLPEGDLSTLEGGA